MRHTAVSWLLLIALALGMCARAWAASYSYDDTVAYSWETASTNVVWELVDTGYPTDDDKQLVNIGFTFNFGGVDYTQVRVMSNGVLHFGADQGFHKDYTNEALPITSSFNGPGFEEPADRVVAVYWTDLNPSTGGTVRYSTLGSAPNRRFVASWESVPHFSGGSQRYTAQAILFENGEIKFQYGGGATSGAGATIGVEVSDSDYTQYSFNSASVTNGDAILFRPSHHYAISHDGNGDLCNAENITITRHYGSHVADTSSYTGTITLSTSTGNGTWSLVTGSGTLTNLGGGGATYAFVAADAGQVVLGLLDTVAETVNINVTDGTYSEDPSEDSNLVFSNTATETFRDEFNAVSYTGNDGTRNWTGSWVEFNDNGSASGEDEQVVSDGGSNRLRVQDNDGGGEGVYREADLSGFDPASTATLSFDYRRNGLDNANDYVAIQVSANGGGSWTELARFAGPGNDSSYQSASYDITSYMASNTRIRFISSANLGNNERVYFDDVQIAVTWTTACAGIDHFAIVHDGMGINCALEPVSVSAKLLDGSIDITYAGTITLDTQSGTGTWSLLSGGGTFSDAVAGDGLATYTYVIADNGVASFNLDYQSGAASIDVDVYEGLLRDDDSEGALVFSPSGFMVTASALSNPPPASIDESIPAQTAASSFSLYIAAYGQTPTDPVCGIIEGYDGAKSLKFWSSYNDPATGTLAVNVNGSAVAGAEGSTTA
jgi:MSHA biogenesis protein MshQ